MNFYIDIHSKILHYGPFFKQEFIPKDIFLNKFPVNNLYFSHIHF